MIRPLPHWVLTDMFPAVYDTESVTAISMVAKLYGKMEELVADYNEFVDDINRYVEEFERGMIADFEKFKCCVMDTMSDYIKTIDMKIVSQDKVIADAVQYMKDNIVATVTQLFNEALANGDITAQLAETYDSTNEELTLSIVAALQESEG